MLQQPPLAPGSFLLGSAGELRRDILPTVARAFRDHGDVVRMRIGPPGLGREITLSFHPDGTHRLLAGNTANYRKDSVNYVELRAALGDGLLTSQDETWTRQKRFLQPLFTQRRVAGYATIMAAETGALVKQWHENPAEERDLHDAMTSLTLFIVCRVLFGEDAGQALPVVQRWFGPMSKAVRQRGMSPLRLPRSWPTPVNRTIAQGQAGLFGLCDRIIARRRAAGAGGDHDMLGMLVDTRDGGEPLSDAEIREQVLVFLLAGHETTATALTFALFHLGQYPEVQERVRAEADSVGGAPTAGQAAALAYTMMTLKETMRLYPSAALIGRRAVEDDEIGGYLIRAGSDVITAPWVTHRHPEFWTSPDTFDPERFTPEQEKVRHRYAWHPFGGGPRACIGQHFSMLEGAIILAGLVHDFAFESPAEIPPFSSDITLRPTAGARVRVSARRVTTGR